MASKRDLVEAHAYNRRRLVAAFLSGAPGGREVEPSRPGRAVIGGAVLAALVVAGSAIFGLVRPGLPSDWDQNNLVISEDTGARYVARGDGRLVPVANTASARLLIPSGEYAVQGAPSDAIADQEIVDPVGIIGAPDTVPEPDTLLQSGWTSCIDDAARTRLVIAARPGAREVDDRAVTVLAGGQTWVLWDDHRHPVGGDAPSVLRALGLAPPALEVPGGWLDLFTLGDALEPLAVEGDGEVPAVDGLPVGAVVGSVLRVGSPGEGDPTDYVVVRDGIVRLTPVAAELRALEPRGEPIQTALTDLGGVVERPATYPSTWPSALPEPWEQPVVCALLTSGLEGAPVVDLAEATEQAARPADDRTGPAVDLDRGALVRAVTGSGEQGTIFLVDATATSYAVVGGPGDGQSVEETQARLGYDGVTPPRVPVAWVEGLRQGPALSIAAASTPVTAAQAAAP